MLNIIHEPLGNLSIFGYSFIAIIFSITWLMIASVLTKNDMRDVGISFFIISGISLVISIVIFENLGANFIFLFFNRRCSDNSISNLLGNRAR